MEKDGKDFRPIVIYLCANFGVMFLIGMILGAIYGPSAMNKIVELSGIVSFIISAIVAIIFIILYHQKLAKDARRLTKKDVILIVVSSVVWLAISYTVTYIIQYFKVPMNNQELIASTFSTSQILTILAAVIFAPFVEEMLFRYSFSTLIKKDITFIIVSAVVFGLLHATNIAAIEYILMGAAFAFVYIKTDKNVIAAFLIHMINNFVAMLSLFLLLK